MLKKLLALFSVDNAPEYLETEEKEVAAAALMVEAALMDGEIDADEEATIQQLLQQHFAISATDSAAVLAQAKAVQADSNHLLRFTRLIKENFDPEERIHIMQMLWQVVLADGEVHHYESNLMRRIAGLIYVTDRDSGLARKRAVALGKG